MHRRAPRLAAASVIGVVLLGCSARAEGQAFSTEFPPLNMGASGPVNRGPTLVEFRDLTGSVDAIAPDVVDRSGEAIGPDSRVVQLDDRPNSVRAHWLGGMCTTVVRMQASAVEGRIVLAISDRWDPPIFGGACPAGGVPRVLAIDFTQPIDATNIDILVNSR